MSSCPVEHFNEYEKVTYDDMMMSSSLPQPITISKSMKRVVCYSPLTITQAKADMAKYCLDRQFKDLFLRDKIYRMRTQRMRSMSAAKLEEYKKKEPGVVVNRLSRRSFKIEQFEKIKIIGRGAFGEVWLVKDKSDQHIYAMKILRKRVLIRKNQILNTIVEKDFLVQNDNPWSVKLYFSFQDKQNLYLVMEFLPGGDLMNLLMARNVLTETETRFLIAEAVMAINNVHKQGFIHRDIKPDNLLLTKDGHVRLTDFGLSTKINRYSDPIVSLIDNLTSSFCECMEENSNDVDEYCHQKVNRLVCSAVGTTDYIAPEVLLKKPYGPSVDYWSVGAIMFEMLYGYAPFLSQNPKMTASKIIHFEQYLNFPANPPVSTEAISLMRGLMTDSDHRLTFEEIKQHPFFYGVDWDSLMTSESPCIPEIKNELDTSHFDYFEPLPDEDNYTIENEQEIENLASIAFMGFQYNRKASELLKPLVA